MTGLQTLVLQAGLFYASIFGISYLSRMILDSFARWFKWKGWTLGPNIPADIKKCVVVAAPHTSNWDFVYSMAALHLFEANVNYLAKKELFKFPMKWILENTGAISVERSKNYGMVESIIQKFNESEKLILVIAGEGTRGKVEKWKSGLYHVAFGAQIPIMPAYLDYAKKEAGFGAPIYPDVIKEKTAAALRAFYADKIAKFPENFNPDSIRF
jgi:1-acyl-sn-glycerol-3-phosphate acyltransferase